MGVREIVSGYRLVYSGTAVTRIETIDASKGAHISDAGQSIVPWHGYVGRALPDDAAAQVRAVRAALLPLDPGLRDVKPYDNPRFIVKQCKGRNLLFTESGNSALLSKLRAELDAEVSSVRSTLGSETDAARVAALRKELLQTLAFKHLMVGGRAPREGVTGAINTYDPAVVTWGMGWAITGYLGQVLAALYEVEQAQEPSDPDKHYAQKLLYLAGFLYDRGTYYVADIDGKTVHSTTTQQISAAVFSRDADPPDNVALRVIHDTVEIHIAWAVLGRDDLTRAALTRAQLRVWKKSTGDLPQADKIQTAALYTLIAHLQHWTGRRLDVVGWATGPHAQPQRVSTTLPSEKGDSDLAVQAIHLLYSSGKPSFNQTRQYWSQMLTEDKPEEGTVDFNPSYPMMSAPAVANVPSDHLAVNESGQLYDLGPLGDFGRGASDNQIYVIDTSRLDLQSVPQTYDPAAEAEQRQRQQMEQRPAILRWLMGHW